MPAVFLHQKRGNPKTKQSHQHSSKYREAEVAKHLVEPTDVGTQSGIGIKVAQDRVDWKSLQAAVVQQGTSAETNYVSHCRSGSGLDLDLVANEFYGYGDSSFAHRTDYSTMCPISPR